MPNYIFAHPKTGEIKEIFQQINDKHEYSENGIKFQRVFTRPNMAVQTKIDPMNPKDFLEKTKNSKGTMGDLFDRSQELSEKRKQIIGKDPIKEQSDREYSKKRKGKKRINPIGDITVEV